MRKKWLFIVLLLILVACNDSYEQIMGNDNSTEISSSKENTKKFQYGKLYAVNNLPKDIYNYLPKDSLDRVLELMACKDSIMLLPSNTKTVNEQNIFKQLSLRGKSGQFNVTLDTWSNGASYFELELTCNVYESGGGDAHINIAKKTSPMNLEIHNSTMTVHEAYYADCVGNSPCQPGFVCSFSASGKIYDKFTSAGVYCYDYICTYRFSGDAISRGKEHNKIIGGII